MIRATARQLVTLLLSLVAVTGSFAYGNDPIRDLQSAAIDDNVSALGHWGLEPGKYTQWGNHSLRLVPVYTYGTLGAGAGVDLTSYTGENSPYRSEEKLKAIYGRVPTNSVSPTAEYCDQTDLARLQRAAAAAGKKHVFLVVFDGLDWHTTRAASIHKTGQVGYESGRGSGLHIQDYQAAGTTQFGAMVTAPHNDGTNVDVNLQSVLNPGGVLPGGYNAAKGGGFAWSTAPDLPYLIAQQAGTPPGVGEHAYPDSAATSTAMCTGEKTYNDAISVDFAGNQLSTMAMELQQKGLAVGIVTSVPFNHATPACAYAHNVHRDDYQDLARDMLGLPSVSHSATPLAGLDVVLGGGYGNVVLMDAAQGANFVAGNKYITAADLKAIDLANGGKYVTVTRQAGVAGPAALQQATSRAVAEKKRLFAMFGCGNYSGHLPFQTADGKFDPVHGRGKKAERYTADDLAENPSLADLTRSAIDVLSTNDNGFWMMLEAGDVDWASHDNNIDNTIGAIHSGDAAVKVITDWVDTHSNWQESVMIITGDHGHYFHLKDPALLISKPVAAAAPGDTPGADTPVAKPVPSAATVAADNP